MSELRMEKLSMESEDITKENVNKIKELFPQVVTEGKIDFDVLKEILGEQIESRNERYQFTWSGKSDSIRFAQRPSTGTLRPDKESSKNWDSTENLYIEGDNLEVLKLLQKSYHNKIKMIYIDPPYNTGGDFVYKDDFKDSIKNYKEQTNQTLRANPETSGRYHTDWLNMMYPRLMLAKNLLSEDGVIFISIDDNEVDNLKKICVEVFGETNFVADLIWTNHEGGGSSDSKLFRIKHEHILCFSKSINLLEILGVEVSNEDRYKSSDQYVAIRGKYYLQKLGMGSIQYSNSLDYPITVPDGTMVTPTDNNGGKKACWRWSKTKFEWGLKMGFIEFRMDSNRKWIVYTKQYLKCDNEGNIIERTQRPMGIISNYSSTQGSKMLDFLGLSSFFNYAKPIELLNYLLNRVDSSDCITLDFFSGSATTAHSVMQLNAEDGGNRKFIMVQLPEKTDEKSEAFKAGYENICEIGKERIRRAGDKIKNELIEKRNKQGMLEDTIDPDQLDIGFKVFKLDTSNLKTFDSTSKDLENIFSEDVFLPERSSLDILYEILLKYGVFDKPVEVIQINGKEAFSIAMNQTIVYINQTITESDVLEIAKLAPREVIFDERGFVNDNDKINALKRLETAGVEKVATI